MMEEKRLRGLGRPRTGRRRKQRIDATFAADALDFIDWLIGPDGNVSNFLEERIRSHPRYRAWLTQRVLTLITELTQPPKGRYVAAWTLADQLGVPRPMFGTVHPGTIYDEVLSELLQQGFIEEVPQLEPRYRLTTAQEEGHDASPEGADQRERFS